MNSEHYNELKVALFGWEPLGAWDKETLLTKRDMFIEEALDRLREALEEVYDIEVENHLAELEHEADWEDE